MGIGTLGDERFEPIGPWVAGGFLGGMLATYWPWQWPNMGFNVKILVDFNQGKTSSVIQKPGNEKPTLITLVMKPREKKQTLSEIISKVCGAVGVFTSSFHL